MEPSEILLRQLSRVYGELLDVAYAPTAVARDPQRLAQSLFDEAASSDDVTSRESAIAICPRASKRSETTSQMICAR